MVLLFNMLPALGPRRRGVAGGDLPSTKKGSPQASFFWHPLEADTSSTAGGPASSARPARNAPCSLVIARTPKSVASVHNDHTGFKSKLGLFDESLESIAIRL